MYDDDENVLAALRAGAYGYTLKGSGPDEIVAAVRAVARGEALFGAGIAARMLSHFGRAAHLAVSAAHRARTRGAAVAGGRPDNAAVARAWVSATRPSATTSPTSSPNCTSPTVPAPSSGPGTRGHGRRYPYGCSPLTLGAPQTRT